MSDALRVGVLARNSFANLIRVASTSLVALLVPVVLVATLRPDLYAVWALLFGLAGFVLYLDFGLPASVQTLVSRDSASGSPAAARAHGVSGMAWSAAIGAVMLAALAVAAANADVLFPALGGVDRMRVVAVVLLLGVGNVATFVGNTAASYFAGLQRSAIAAATLVPGRVASLLIAVPVAAVTQDLVLVAASYALPLSAGGIAMVVQVLRAPRDGRPSSRDRLLVLRFSGPLAMWSVYMLCISGVGILVVGRVDFRAVAVFSLGAAFASALTAVVTALVSPVLSELGRSHAAQDRARFTGLVLTGTRVDGALVAMGVVGIEAAYLVAAPFLSRSQGVPVDEASLIIAFAVLASGLRLTVTPLTFSFVAAGAHRKLLLPPLCEAVLTLAATIGLGVAFGGAGVAAGMLVGAIGGVTLALVWSHRVTGVVDASAPRLAVAAVGRPLVAVLPAQVAFAALAPVAAAIGAAVSVPAGVVLLLVTAALAWRVCLPADVRVAIVDRVRHRTRPAVAGARS